MALRKKVHGNQTEQIVCSCGELLAIVQGVCCGGSVVQSEFVCACGITRTSTYTGVIEVADDEGKHGAA